MAYKGTPLYTAGRGPVRGDADRARVRPARARARRERRRDRQAAGAGARARRHRAALARPHAARGGRGRGDQPRDPARRDRRLRRCSSCTSPAPRRSRRSSARTRAGARSTPRRARSTSCSPTPTSPAPDFEGAKYVLLAAAARPVATGRRCGTACRARTCTSSAPTTARSTSPGRRSSARDDFTLIPNGAPGRRGARRRCCGRTACARGEITENLFVAVLSTNQAKVHGMAGRKGVLAPGADADIVVWDPDLTITATQANRHGNVDYTPYEGMTFTGGAGGRLRARRARLPRRRGARRARLGPLRAPHVRAARARRRRSADGERRRRARGRGAARARARCTGDEDGAQRVAWTDTWIARARVAARASSTGSTA